MDFLDLIDIVWLLATRDGRLIVFGCLVGLFLILVFVAICYWYFPGLVHAG